MLLFGPLVPRKKSIARCFAVAISQAPGLSGMPDSGHCSSAATSASCARSSATPTSRTIRVKPAISLGDSILHTASIARCAWVAVTGTHHTIFNRPTQAGRIDAVDSTLNCVAWTAPASPKIQPLPLARRLENPRTPAPDELRSHRFLKLGTVPPTRSLPLSI